VDRNWQFLSVSVDQHPVIPDQIKIFLTFRFSGQKVSTNQTKPLLSPDAKRKELVML